MATRRLDSEIDRLYQLPLDEFTAARNALAKEGGASVRELTKPPLAAWAVNQLYWKQRPVYDDLMAAAESQRKTHKAVLGGRAGDLRAVGKAHDEAVDAALKATVSLAASAGHPVTDATRQAVLNTLRALPSDDPPGRLSRALQPGGFEMLAGLTVAGATRRQPDKPPAPPPKTAKQKTTPAAKPDPKAVARAREAVASATRDLRQAEHTARREEFEAARAARDIEKAERAAEEARAAFETAKEALEEAEAAVPPAQRARDATARKAREFETALEAARESLEAAQKALKEVTGGRASE